MFIPQTVPSTHSKLWRHAYDGSQSSSRPNGIHGYMCITHTPDLHGTAKTIHKQTKSHNKKSPIACNPVATSSLSQSPRIRVHHFSVGGCQSVGFACGLYLTIGISSRIACYRSISSDPNSFVAGVECDLRILDHDHDHLLGRTYPYSTLVSVRSLKRQWQEAGSQDQPAHLSFAQRSDLFVMRT